MTDEPQRGVHLTDKQVVFAVMAASVVAVVVFLSGVFVGRGVQAVRPAEVATADTRVGPDVAPPVTEAEAGPTVGGDVTTGALPPENLTYPGRLTEPQPTPEALQFSRDTGPPVPPDAPDLAASDLAQPGGTPREPAAAAPSGTAPAGGPAAPALEPEASAVAGAYTVQVAAVKRQVEAQDIAAQLKKKGFPAYVFAPPQGDARGGFRVRVGSFKSRQEAAVMAARLQKEKYQPWITR